MTSQETLLETLIAKPVEVIEQMTDAELETYFQSVLEICRPEIKKKFAGESKPKLKSSELTEQQKAVMEEILKNSGITGVKL